MGKLLFSICVVFSFFLIGCASSMSGSAYSRDQARQLQTVREGTVVAVRPVRIEGTKSGLGTIAGGVLGGALGSAVGEGSGKVIGIAAGGVGGAIAGSAVEEGVTRQNGLEITVRLDSGETVAIVQAADEQFAPGERVKVVSGAESRVTH